MLVAMVTKARILPALAAVLLMITAAVVEAQSNGPALPYTPSLDPTAMDRSVDPCMDFYKYSCGNWSKKNPIPPDRTAWAVYSKAYEDNLVLLRGILENSAAAKDRDPVTQKVGDFYAACVDEAAANRRGLAAIKPQLDDIASIKNARDLAAVAGRLQLVVAGSSILFGVGSQQDYDNTEQQIADLDQGGIALPDRDYYTKDDAKSKEIRERYVQYVEKIFTLMGDSPAAAKQNAAMVMRLETSLARASQTSTERRDPYKLKHKMKPAELNALAPKFNWDVFFRTVQTPKLEIVNVSSPDFFKELNQLLATEPISSWKTYLRFHITSAYARYLSDDFVLANYGFYSQYLRGAKEISPRWKRCVQYADDYLGEALGQEYVRRVFSPELKASTSQMVQGIEQAMEVRINQLDWMSPETKKQALVKLHAVRNKIGYPDKWRDYNSVKITPDDLVRNMRNAIAFESHRQLNKIGQPVDHGEWDITPTTVDAYYNPLMNDINFPAGVLQPPLYDPKMDDAPNYGNTGTTIGHELTHAFDDEGRQFDAKGNLKDWWTKEDADKFTERAQCVADQYAQYVVVDDIHINSKLTLGEDVADLGGTILAYLAWKEATKDKHLESADALTPDQRFFVGFAQWDCGEVRPEQARDWAITNPHSPPEYRINGVVVNMPEFSEAFSCKAGQPMSKPKEKVCKVW